MVTGKRAVTGLNMSKACYNRGEYFAASKKKLFLLRKL
jgi:hypothetical protein